MLTTLAAVAETTSAASAEPVRVLVLAILLVAIVGLTRLGTRQRQGMELREQLDLEWVRLDD